jgi:hypothetical protein
MGLRRHEYGDAHAVAVDAGMMLESDMLQPISIRSEVMFTYQ